jgi:heat shock protein HslJ
MACPGDGLMRQESAILNLLQGRLAVAYDPFAGTIELSGDGGSMLLRRAP